MSGNKVITIINEVRVNEMEIKLVKMIADSMTAKDIAEKTGENIRTIESRIFTIKKKYGVKNPAGLVILFYRNKLII